MHGDAGLAEKLQSGLGRRHPVAAAATVKASTASAGTDKSGEVTLASLGASLDADFEIGSVSKGITGLLYADACSRREVGPDSTLGELLPLGDCPAAGLSLAAVSRHSSGLPRLPRSAAPLRRTVRFLLHGTNPYGESLEELLAQARTVGLPALRAHSSKSHPSTPHHATPQYSKPRYSNLGFELLGHAVASGAGMSYRDLVRTRLSVPLGLGSVYAPAAVAELGPKAVSGRSRRGRAMEPWTGEALAPAGGIRASITDMARLAQALLDGSAPGLAALDPVANFAGPAARIGAAWMTLEVKGRAITWHNGGTGGFRSWFGLDREAGTAVVILSATAASVDRQGFRLLQELTDGS